MRERKAQQQQQLIELFKVQDKVAAEIARAYCAGSIGHGPGSTRRKLASRKPWCLTPGNLTGLGQTTRVGEMLVLVTRPQEAVAALQQLARSYDNYFTSLNDYNRTELRLFRALGYASDPMAGDHPGDPCLPVDTSRPTQKWRRLMNCRIRIVKCNPG